MLRATLGQRHRVTGLLIAVCVAITGCAGMKKPGETDEASQANVGTNNENPARYRARLHTELGANYLQRGQFAVALDELREANRVDPTYGLAHSIMALVHANLGEDAKAEAAFSPRGRGCTERRRYS